MDLQMGVYRHYKGHLYQVLGLASDANAEEFTLKGLLDKGYEPVEAFPSGRIVVVYIGLQLDGAQPGRPRMHVRTLEDFTAWVVPNLPGTRSRHPHDAAEEMSAFDEGWRPRFQYLGAYASMEIQ